MGNLRDKYTNEEWEEIGERIRDAKNKPETKTITYTEKDFKEMVNGWNEEREALEKEIKRLREKLKYAYNKAYILYHSHKSSDVRADIRKLFYSVEEFEHIKGEGK
jgi:archaellum component FlaC